MHSLDSVSFQMLIIKLFGLCAWSADSAIPPNHQARKKDSKLLLCVGGMAMPTAVVSTLGKNATLGRDRKPCRITKPLIGSY